MPIHDWTRVDAGIFHDFHHAWIEEIKRALNRGLLPPDFYAMAEQIAGGLGPDVLTLQAPPGRSGINGDPEGGLALAAVPPKVHFHARLEVDRYAEKAKAVVVRHTSDHRVVAVVEVVSPGNKSSKLGLRKFVEKAAEFLRGDIHPLIIDLFPPGPRDPQGIHKAIWDEFEEVDFQLPEGSPLTLAAYMAGMTREAFVEPVAVGARLADMPLFLTRHTYVLVPLDPTYQAAWDAVPAYWRGVLAGSTPS